MVTQVFNIQVCLGGADEGSELTLVLALHLLESENSSRLLVYDRTETSLALYNNVGDTHLTAQGRKENDELNGVDIMRDNDESRLLRLDECHTVVETVLDEKGLLGVLGGLLSLGSLLGCSLKTSLLFLLRLRAVPGARVISAMSKR